MGLGLYEKFTSINEPLQNQGDQPVKYGTVLILIFFAMSGLAQEMREWRSSDGSQTFLGNYVTIRNDRDVILLGEEQQHVRVPIAKLSDEDQAYLFQAESRKARNNSAGKIRGLTYKQGEVLGPIEAMDGSSFFLYVPQSLPHNRPAPLLLFTGPTGGRMPYIKDLVKGAEVLGWIVAVVVESNYYNSVDVNRAICNSVVQTLLDTAPIDRRRLYFSGFSAGASVSYYNGKKWQACGLIPTSTYIPPRLDPPSCDTVLITGGSDFNRYTSAYARKQIGKNAVHWFHPEGHKTAPAWMLHDAMALLESRFLERYPDNNEQELNLYIYSMIEWIDEIKEKHPHRAYYWAGYLRDHLELNILQRMKLEELFQTLENDEQNQLYVQGLADLDALALTHLGTITRESRLNFNDPSLITECEPLLQKYKNTPVITDVLQALCSQTDEPACVQPHWEE
jgi:predicted esterase